MKLTNVLSILAASLEFGGIVRNGERLFFSGASKVIMNGEEQLNRRQLKASKKIQ
jgi:hypothetical protein